MTENAIDENVAGIEDPGQDEGKVKEETGDPSDRMDEDHPRFKEVYGNWRDTERALGAVTEKAAGTENALNEMRRVNEGLMTKFTEMQSQSAPEIKDDYEDKITELRAAKEQALKDEDLTAYNNASNAVEDLITARSDLNKASFSMEDIEKKISDGIKAGIEAKSATDVNSYVTAKADWANPQSPNYDPIMHNALSAMDSQVQKDPAFSAQGFMGQIDEAIKRTEQRFSYTAPNINNNNDRINNPGSPFVGGAAPTGGRGDNVITLSPEERRTSHMMFPGDDNAEAKYAAQIKITGRAE